jgi:hypothetical protein
LLLKPDWGEVSTTRDSGLVRSHQAHVSLATHPPALAGGTDCVQRIVTILLLKPDWGEVSTTRDSGWVRSHQAHVSLGYAPTRYRGWY